MDIVWKSLIGAVLTALIAWLAKQGHTLLPGVLPLSPTFGLIALWLIGMQNDTHTFQATCIASLKTIPAYLVFVGACHWGIERLNFESTLLLGLVLWFVMAGIMFAAWR